MAPKRYLKAIFLRPSNKYLDATLDAAVTSVKDCFNYNIVQHRPTQDTQNTYTSDTSVTQWCHIVFETIPYNCYMVMTIEGIMISTIKRQVPLAISFPHLRAHSCR